ncbi:hypothetical protein [Mesorhizobium sp. INR15]|uniref:hypothetical protein n=1 Tax=Mesorhizobium sp. INR15 TaxID=2654248 RepID=UPI001896A11E|nr:hypothetical protein [Mesorhizobium sp. INR15]QPC90015.1 hypothetical protein GA829_05090 [Mesorhizobium sp. INR15]
MPIKSSPYFHDPAFAQAAQNLAGLFEPPSGADAAGWAAANAKKAESQRLADFYDYQKNPNFDQQTFDRMGVAAGAYQPNQSYYSVNVGDQTTRRGQDVTAATSRANNADDNARALQTNSADNTRAVETNRVSELGKLYQPLSEGQVRPDVPADIAGNFGVSHDLPAAQGRAKALSETEVQGGLVQKMRDAGLISDDMVVDRFAGDKTPVEAIGPDGKPRYMSPGAAVRAGAAPYDAPKGAGMTTTLPDGTVIQLGGSAGGKTTEFQGKQDAYVTRMAGMQPILDQLGTELTDFQQAAYDALPTVGTIKTGNGMLTENYQKASNAGRVFLQSVLRLDSGAAIPPAEEAQYGDVFLPRPGDKPGTIQQKMFARNLAMEGVKAGMTPEQVLATGRAVIAAGSGPKASSSPPGNQAQPTGGQQSTSRMRFDENGNPL